MSLYALFPVIEAFRQLFLEQKSIYAGFLITKKFANNQKKGRLTGKKGATNKPTEGRPSSFQVMQSQDTIFLGDSTIIIPGDAKPGHNFPG
jgi:hypothetical protein